MKICRLVACFAATFFLTACDFKSSSGGASNEALPSIDSRVVWRNLPDASFGWAHDDKYGSDVERCWKGGAVYNCVRVSRMYPPEYEIEVQKNILVMGLVRKSLKQESIIPEHGYNCQISDPVHENLSLNNGAAIGNTITMNSIMHQRYWTQEFVRDYVAKNDPTTQIVHFNCEALKSFFDDANEAAFLTSAISASQLGIVD